MPMFKKILVPIDISEPQVSGLGVTVAGELAAMGDSEITLLHVLPKISEALGKFLPQVFDGIRENAVRATLQAFAQRANLPKALFKCHVRSGTPYHEVLADAEDFGADLIIIGSRSPSASTYLLGSNAEKIVRHAKCSVLIARPRKDEEGVYWLIPPIAS
jgi:nucleotide-binding universal stress UspA family protein